MPPRVAAVHAVTAVLGEGRALDSALGGVLPRVAERDRPLVQALVYGVLRWLPRLEARIAALTRHDGWKRDPRLHALLLVGAWEAEGLATPDHAAVSEAVGAARILRRQRAAGMVNAVLRRIRQNPPPDQDSDEIRYALPAWLLERLRRDWPDEWRRIAAAGNEHPPMTLRVNLSRTDRESYLARLADTGIPARAGAAASSAVILDTPRPVGELPGFGDGDVSVQDEAAQLAAPLLNARAGHRVLDACAAPGGKTGHLLERCPGAEVTAIDLVAERLERVRENLARIGATAGLVAGNAAAPASWWDGRPFHRILVDAPCTGTGVIRRHPDIKWLRRDRDVAALAGRQLELLRALWPLLAPGGIMVYATCSVLDDENRRVVRQFREERPEAAVLPPPQAARMCGDGGQILPGDGGMDGFFYAALRRPEGPR